MEENGKRSAVKVWGPEEDDLLLTMKDDGYMEKEIARVLGVTKGQLKYRLALLGYYDDAHSYERRELPSDRPVALPLDEAMRAAYRLLGVRDFAYNPGGEQASLPVAV